jgi:hypothetical protein
VDEPALLPSGLKVPFKIDVDEPALLPSGLKVPFKIDVDEPALLPTGLKVPFKIEVAEPALDEEADVLFCVAMDGMMGVVVWVMGLKNSAVDPTDADVGSDGNGL